MRSDGLARPPLQCACAGVSLITPALVVEAASLPHLEPVGTGFPGAAAARPDGARTPAPRPSPESIVDNTDHSIDPTDEMAKKAHDYRLHRDENEPPEGLQPPPLVQRERYDRRP